MGTAFMDSFSLLHFAVGIVVYFWSIPLWLWVILHTIFEYVENTQLGMYVINEYITLWPGGKSHPDSFINSLGDTFFGSLGWVVAYFVHRTY